MPRASAAKAERSWRENMDEVLDEGQEKNEQIGLELEMKNLEEASEKYDKEIGTWDEQGKFVAGEVVQEVVAYMKEHCPKFGDDVYYPNKATLGAIK